MADVGLDILVKVTDEATANLEQIQSDVQDLSDETQKAGEEIDSSFKDVEAAAKSLSAVFVAAGAAIGAALIYSVGQAREAAAGQKELNSLLEAGASSSGFNAEMLNGLATSLANTTNFTDEAVLAAENMLLTFNKIGTETMPMATETVLNIATKMGSDATSAAIQLGKALQDPIDGVSALSRIGVSFTADQKKVIETLVNTGEVAAAQAIILEAINKDNHLANMAQNAFDPLIELKDQVGELGEEVGKQLLPYITEIANGMLDWLDSVGGVSGVLEKLNEFIKENETQLYMLAGIVGTTLVIAFYSLAAAATAALIPMLPYIAIGAAIGLVIYGIVKAVEWLIAVWPELSKAFGEAWDWIVGKFDEAKTAVLATMDSVWAGIQSAFSFIQEAFDFFIAFTLGAIILAFEMMGIDIVDIFNSIVGFLTSIWETISNVFSTGINTLSSLWQSAWGVISTFTKGIWETMKTVFTDAIASITAVFSPWIETLQNTWTTMWDSVTSAAETAWEAAKDIVKSGINWVIEKVNAMIKSINDIVSKGASVLGITPVKISTIPLLASGGDVVGAGSAIVGEAGPELVSLNRGARVTPLDKAGQTLVININNPMILSNEDIVEKIGNPIIQVLKQHAAII